jgi:protoporphyrinogen oxidase
MPVKQLVNSLQSNVPSEVKRISEGLVYRDFITVGLLVNKLSIQDKDKSDKLINDNWIYVQESDVLLGRIQIFNNWSPYLVEDNSKVWLGLEYFCYETDNLWKMTDEEMANFAIDEMVKIKFICRADVLDYTVIKVPKTYPAYFGTYPEFEKVQSYLNGFENLYLIGRNGMHRYNNQDHSMLTAMAAVDNIKHHVKDKANIWQINTEKDYHESKSKSEATTSDVTTPEVKATVMGNFKQQLKDWSRQFVGYLFTGG